MKVLKQISVFLLLLIIVFSSLGISFYLHDCHCHKTLYVSLGTAFSVPTSVCGTSCSTVSLEKNDQLSIGKKGCCRDFVYFYILPVAPENPASQIAHASETQLFIQTKTTIEKAEISPNNEIIPFYHQPPPLLAGKNLVYFIRQIRIPFPSC